MSTLFIVREYLADSIAAVAHRVRPPRRASPPDGQLLDRMVPHVAHEMAAMEKATQLWTDTGVWIALEDALLHARLLTDFFWPTTGRYADSAVLAEHYMPAWRDKCGAPPAVVRAARKALHRQLAHLSRERVTKPQDLGVQARGLADAVWDGWARLLGMMGQTAHSTQLRAELSARAIDLGVQLPPGAT
ncbi:MAG: hypothetical protein NTU91_17820 [Chloroflexi bacterium]|nr:hypothetical protein [Chloroflexota bacterium]